MSADIVDRILSSCRLEVFSFFFAVVQQFQKFSNWYKKGGNQKALKTAWVASLQQTLDIYYKKYVRQESTINVYQPAKTNTILDTR